MQDFTKSRLTDHRLEQFDLVSRIHKFEWMIKSALLRDLFPAGQTTYRFGPLSVSPTPDDAGAVRRRSEEAGGSGGGDPLLHVAELALVAAKLPADDAEEDSGEEHEEAEEDEHRAHHLRGRAHSLQSVP